MADPIILPPNSKAIPLSQGKYAIVDAEDYEWLNQWKWYAKENGKSIYAGRNLPMPNQKQKRQLMHRLIMNNPHEFQIDHINGNGLDNRKINLRLCKQYQNTKNKKARVGKYKGIGFDEKRGKWRAQIKVNYKSIWLGYFKTDIEAAMAYNKAATELFGEFACLNQIPEPAGEPSAA